MDRPRKSIQYPKLIQPTPLTGSQAETVLIDKYQPNYPNYIIRKAKVVIVFLSHFIAQTSETITSDKWQAILPTRPIGYRTPILVAENESFGIPIIPIDWLSEWQMYSPMNRVKNFFWTQLSYMAPSRVIPGGAGHVRNLPLLGVG